MMGILRDIIPKNGGMKTVIFRLVSYGNLARKMFQGLSKVGRNCLSVIWGDTPWFTSDSVLVTMIVSFGHTHLTLLVIIISHYYPIKSPLYLMCVPSNPHIPFKFTRKDSHHFYCIMAYPQSVFFHTTHVRELRMFFSRLLRRWHGNSMVNCSR